MIQWCKTVVAIRTTVRCESHATTAAAFGRERITLTYGTWTAGISRGHASITAASLPCEAISAINGAADLRSRSAKDATTCGCIEAADLPN